MRSKGFWSRERRELAFFGGTFTGLSLPRMKALLAAAAPRIDDGTLHSVRISTRPDALDPERLAILKDYHVKTVELGVQSMDDRVLALSRRGHTAEDTENAVKTLKRHGFSVGIQLMPGLPGDSRDVFRATTEKVLGLRPRMVRIYPALVIKGTKMAQLYEEGAYRPFSLKEALAVCKKSVILFEEKGIPVIRIGLLGASSLTESDQVMAGPWHPAFGFLVRSAIHVETIMPGLPDFGEASGIKLYSPKREIPLVRGYKNRGLRAIERMTGARVTGVLPDDTIPSGRIRWETT